MTSSYGRVGVLCGGRSDEREVSLRSGANVVSALRARHIECVEIDPANDDIREFSIDRAFIALHGDYGEDGKIQGHLETLGIPYTGSGVLASAVGMDKPLFKRLLREAGYPTARSASMTSEPPYLQSDLQFPIIVKPCRGGSSVGTIIVDDPSNRDAMLSAHSTQFPDCFAEEFIDGTEITVSILEHRGTQLELPILELVPHNTFYDYDAKYTQGKTDFVLPARISPDLAADCQRMAIGAFQLIGCRAMARVDMIIHPDRGPHILEINTIPGLTSLSDLPAQAAHAGISFEDLVVMILDSAT